MPNHRVKVSIGVPVYNGEEFLEETLDSLLSQTFEDFELIISDNASTDGTGDIARRVAARDSRVRYHRRHQNLGLAANYNGLVTMASGELFKWATADDPCRPAFLEQCLGRPRRNARWCAGISPHAVHCRVGPPARHRGSRIPAELATGRRSLALRGGGPDAGSTLFSVSSRARPSCARVSCQTIAEETTFFWASSACSGASSRSRRPFFSGACIPNPPARWGRMGASRWLKFMTGQSGGHALPEWKRMRDHLRTALNSRARVAREACTVGHTWSTDVPPPL